MLDLETVRVFVLIAELGSFTRTAEALDLSQAAVSLKLKRLEDRLGERLVARTPRSVRLLPAGEAFLAAARDLLAAHARAVAGLAAVPDRLTLGISDHVGGAELPRLLARLAAADASLLIEARIASSREVMAAYDRGETEAAILRRQEGRGEGVVIARDRLAWFAAPDFAHRSGGPLRLAALASGCGVRAIATAALDAAGIAWTEVFTGGGVAALVAAVSAGLGVAALARRVAPADAVDVTAAFGLPALPECDVMLLERAQSAAGRRALRMLAAALR